MESMDRREKQELSKVMGRHGVQWKQIKENNNTIRNLTGEYKKIEPDCREEVRAQLERLKELCKERKIYEKRVI